VERGSDRDQLETSVQFDRLCGAGDPLDGVVPSGLCLGPTEGHGLRLLVDRHDVAEAAGQWNGDLTGAARQVQQPARARRGQSFAQVVEQRRRVRAPVAIVERGGPTVEMGGRHRLGIHRPMMAVPLAEETNGRRPANGSSRR
jgi:hypothetical protein